MKKFSTETEELKKFLLFGINLFARRFCLMFVFSGAEDVFNLASTKRNRQGVSRSYSGFACLRDIKRILIGRVSIQDVLLELNASSFTRCRSMRSYLN